MEQRAAWAQDAFPAGLAPWDGSQAEPAEQDAFAGPDAFAVRQVASAAAPDDSRAEPAELGELAVAVLLAYLLPDDLVLAGSPEDLLLDDFPE